MLAPALLGRLALATVAGATAADDITAKVLPVPPPTA